jgi:S1-C subfamily serine protease
MKVIKTYRLSSITLLFILLFPLNVFSQKTTILPKVSSTNCNSCKISKIELYKDKSLVYLNVTGIMPDKQKPWVLISEFMILTPPLTSSEIKELRTIDLQYPETPKVPNGGWSDYQFEKIKQAYAEALESKNNLRSLIRIVYGNRLIKGLGQYNLNTKYSIKQNSTIEFILEFPPLEMGIEVVDLFEFSGGFEFFGVKIINPIDESFKTNWTEIKLKESWKTSFTPIEGIYESVGRSENLKVAIVKEKDKYMMLYLSGKDNTMWSEGNLQADLSITAKNNLFKLYWFSDTRSEVLDGIISFESTSFKILFSKDNKEETYIKLFPTNNNNFGSNEYEISSGTGFAISSNGYIVTNHHVIENAKSIVVKGINGDFNTEYNAEIKLSDRNNDLAILQIVDSKFKTLGTIPYLISTKTYDVGSSIYVLGYPLRATMGDEIKLTNGIISSKSGFQGDITSYQITAPVQPGNSGGPLFDNKGNILGIINAKHAGAENASYAIKAIYLNNLIDLLNPSISLQTINSLSNKVLTEQVKIINKYVYIIEVKY